MLIEDDMNYILIFFINFSLNFFRYFLVWVHKSR
jgi:hypothetical protein